MMPFRCDIGIFSCLNMELLAPSDCRRRSVALCRLAPLKLVVLDESSRWGFGQQSLECKVLLEIGQHRPSPLLLLRGGCLGGR